MPVVHGMKSAINPIWQYVLGGVGAVGGYSYGVNQEWLPLALCVGVGLVGGLLLIELLAHLTEFTIGALIVAAAAAGMWWLSNNEASLKHRQAAPVEHAAPARRSGGWLAQLPGVRL